MKSLPTITIATVTYNAEATLDRTLASVAQQDYPKIEHLIVDGCSQDHTLSHVQRYVERNTHQQVPHNIRLIRENDEGLYDAMNKAIRNCTGDYIVFLNAGDCLHGTDIISRVVEKIEWVRGDYSNPAVIYGETDLVDNDGNFVRHRRLKAPQTLSWYNFASGMLVCHQSFYVRTDIAREEQYNLGYRYSADYDWCIRILKKAARRRLMIVNTKAILTDYLNEGMTTRNHRKSLMERLNVMARHYGWPTAIMQHLWFVVRAVVVR